MLLQRAGPRQALWELKVRHHAQRYINLVHTTNGGHSKLTMLVHCSHLDVMTHNHLVWNARNESDAGLRHRLWMVSQMV